MSNRKRHEGEFLSSHLLILLSYTVFSVILFVESIVMKWELWVLPLICVGMLFCWYLHITQTMLVSYRMWIYVVVMLASFFFYGIHETSTFDLAAVMSMAIMLFTFTGNTRVILLSQLTYYVTMGYDLFAMAGRGFELDKLVISRCILHLILIFVVGMLSRVIIRKWNRILLTSDADIEKLADATRRMDDFLANVSHEIRTPINAVIGLTAVMQKKENNETIKKDMHAVSDAGYRISYQISDILDYTEIDMDKLVVSDESYMVASLINDLIPGLAAMKKPELELIIDVDAGLPNLLSGDAGKIKKILWHIILNGLKYTKHGGVYVRISSVEQPYGINLSIEVSDTGIGMKDDDIDRIFERFYQSDSSRSRSAGGLGIGMSIVQGFVQRMGGFLTIDSEPGNGTTVTVSIPQKVIDGTGCMSIENSRQLCVAGFFQFDKYEIPQVREYYNNMISNLAKGLNVPFYKADDLEALRKLKNNYRLTHLLVAEEEYNSAAGYIESLTSEMIVAVIANPGFMPVKDSGVKIINKPFYCFPVITVLNMNIKDNNEEEVYEHMYCPGLRALVVDDEPMNLLVAEGIFSNYGMIVSTVNSGPEAIAACEKEHYDVIFMDHMMPEMDGIEAMKRIRSVMSRKDGAGDYVIIALTANAVSSAKEMFLSEGFDGFVPKPVELSELERVLKHVLPKDAIQYRAVASGNDNMDDNDKSEKEDTDEGKSHDEDSILGDRIISLLEKNGVKTQKGLRYCQYDEEFYRSLLIEYGMDAGKKLADLRDYYANKNWDNYTIRVHAIKSTSKMIGAEELSDIAKFLETASKEENVTGIDSYHDDMMDRYTAILNVISEITVDEEPEDATDDDIFEFAPEDDQGDDILEFAPEDNS